MGTESTLRVKKQSNEEAPDSVLPPAQNTSKEPVYVSPSEFKMRVLRKLVTADNSNEGKTVKKYQRQNSDRTLKASIVFPNGDVGTIISYERMDSKKETDSENNIGLPELKGNDTSPRKPKERPLRLPPIILPPIYSTKPHPIIPRDFNVPTEPPGPLTDDAWEELQECRYLRLYSRRKSTIYG